MMQNLDEQFDREMRALEYDLEKGWITQEEYNRFKFWMIQDYRQQENE